MEIKDANIINSSLPDGTAWRRVVNREERSAREAKLKKACADFESLFISQMFKTMRKTIPESGLLTKIAGKDTYEMMMDQKVAEELASKGGLGLQRVLFDQLNKGK